jgi:hypothetical protein
MNVIEDLGYVSQPIILHQDNTSTIHLAENGKSNSDRTKHINIRYFFIYDKIMNGEVKVTHTSTDNMIADILTKPLHGELFHKLRRQLLNNNV